VKSVFLCLLDLFPVG